METNTTRHHALTLPPHNAYQDHDVDMLDAHPLDCGAVLSPPRASSSSSAPAPDHAGVPTVQALGAQAGNNKRRRKRNRRKNKAAHPSNIADINRFVLDTCKRLKEKKSYLVWNAVACLGVTAVCDLVKEVEAIEKCGGQMTVDGKRMRTGGGILWNILKTREPKAYKEIMLKGKEFEKKLRNPRPKLGMMKSNNEETSSQTSTVVPEEEIELLDAHEPLVDDVPPHEEELPAEPATERRCIRDRMRVPVTYDDLFEEGEIHD